MGNILATLIQWGIIIIIVFVVLCCIFFIFWYSLNNIRIWLAKRKNKEKLQRDFARLKDIERGVKNARQDRIEQYKRLDEFKASSVANDEGKPTVKESVATGTIREDTAKGQDGDRNPNADVKPDSATKPDVRPIVRNNKRDRELPKPPIL